MNISFPVYALWKLVVYKEQWIKLVFWVSDLGLDSDFCFCCCSIFWALVKRNLEARPVTGQWMLSVYSLSSIIRTYAIHSQQWTSCFLRRLIWRRWNSISGWGSAWPASASGNEPCSALITATHLQTEIVHCQVIYHNGHLELSLLPLGIYETKFLVWL